MVKENCFKEITNEDIYQEIQNLKKLKTKIIINQIMSSTAFSLTLGIIFWGIIV